jgi:hypothetical protein
MRQGLGQPLVGFALVKVRDVVSERGDHRVTGGHDCRALGGEQTQSSEEVITLMLVKSGGRLVEEQDPRVTQ